MKKQKNNKKGSVIANGKKYSLTTLQKKILMVVAIIVFAGIDYGIYAYISNNSVDAAVTKPYIVSANIKLQQTVDVNQNGKMNLRVIADNSVEEYYKPTDELKISISDIVLSNSRLRDNQYNLYVFATCKTKSLGINYYGYPTRTWIQTAIPASQKTIEVNFSERIEARLIDPSYDSSGYFIDFANSGADCNIELGLKSNKLGAASMSNYAWFPYVNTSYYTTHPLSNHPYSFEILPENSL